MSDSEKKLLNLIKSKEFNDYLGCLEKSPKNKEGVKKIRDLMLRFSEIIKDVDAVKASKDIHKILKLALDAIDVAKQIITIETNKEMMTYGAQKCTKELVAFSILKNNIQKENLESMEKQLQMTIEMMSKPPAPVYVASSSKSKTSKKPNNK